MGNPKRRSHTERLPMDFEQPRKQQPDVHNDMFASLGALVNNTEEKRMEVLQVITFVHQRGDDTPERRAEARELMFALGVAESPATALQVSGPIEVACPRCGVPARSRCVSIASGDPMGGSHVARQRIAENIRRGAA